MRRQGSPCLRPRTSWPLSSGSGHMRESRALEKGGFVGSLGCRSTIHHAAGGAARAGGPCSARGGWTDGLVSCLGAPFNEIQGLQAAKPQQCGPTRRGLQWPPVGFTPRHAGLGGRGLPLGRWRACRRQEGAPAGGKALRALPGAFVLSGPPLDTHTRHPSMRRARCGTSPPPPPPSRRRAGAPAPAHCTAASPLPALLVCLQVEGCDDDLTSLRPFYQRLRICGEQCRQRGARLHLAAARLAFARLLRFRPPDLASRSRTTSPSQHVHPLACAALPAPTPQRRTPRRTA